ncbi:MAG TPA: methyltransferase [Candidatus Limnocylindrales bacterium]|nr:methyltransferase [Candidatus Limnocylindrales bacterium]
MILIRYLCLLVPIAVLLVASRFDRTKHGRAGALLAAIGVMAGVAAQHEVAKLAGWWRFAPVDGAFRGLPVDLWLGWAMLWGAVPVLLRRFVPVPIVLIGLFWLDAVAMPRMGPLLELGPQWMVGELVGLIFVALPAILAGRWSADRVHLWPRVVLQMVIFASLALWLVPVVAFELGGGSWPRHQVSTIVQIGLLIGVPAVTAVLEFARRGGGTPYPWDPPRRLVTTGPYAYIANPMQASMAALLAFLAIVTGAWALALAAAWVVAFSMAVAAIHEREQLRGRHGQQWMEYRGQVRDWLPRLRPYCPMVASRGVADGTADISDSPPSAVPAVLFLDFGCGPCSVIRDEFARRQPVGLTLADAAAHPQVLWRARYEAADGYVATGVVAVARAMEHVHLGWACAGWVLRLPGVAWLAQQISDAVIVAPHPARGGTCPAPSSGSSTAPCGRSASTASRASRPAR